MKIPNLNQLMMTKEVIIMWESQIVNDQIQLDLFMHDQRMSSKLTLQNIMTTVRKRARIE